MTLTPGKLWGMRRLADADGFFRMLAVDQRPPIKGPIARALDLGEAPWEEVAEVKALLVETLQGHASALLLDPHYAIPRAVDRMDPRKGLVATLEDSVFQDGPEGRLSAEIDDWSVAKIKRMGGDAVKALIWYRPDAPEPTRRAQQDLAARIGEACARCDIPFLLELLVYPLAAEAERSGEVAEMRAKKVEHVLGSVEEFAKPRYGVDIFKLESPLPVEDVPGPEVEEGAEAQALFDEMGRLAGRPWVMLSAGAGRDDFRRIVGHAARAGASGFLAGRAIWADAFRLYPKWGAMQAALEGEAANYLAVLGRLAAQGRPWREHPCYGPGGARFHPAEAAFRHGYEGF